MYLTNRYRITNNLRASQSLQPLQQPFFSEYCRVKRRRQRGVECADEVLDVLDEPVLICPSGGQRDVHLNRRVVRIFHRLLMQ